MAMKKEKKDAEVRKNTLPVASTMDAELAADSGSGFEEATRDAYAVPFLSILQDLSPQVKPKMSGYIKGATPGKIYQSVSQELFDSIRVIPCYFSQVFIEWIPRNKGGGFVKTYDPAHGAALAGTAVRDGARNILPNSNELQDTRQHFVLLVREGGAADGCLLPMKSTQLKVSRRWMSQMKSAVVEVQGRIVTPPMFAWSYKLGVEEESNDQGSWYSWTVQDRERVTDPGLYSQAKAFCQMMKSGAAKVNYEEMQKMEGGGGSDRPADLDNDLDA